MCFHVIIYDIDFLCMLGYVFINNMLMYYIDMHCLLFIYDVLRLPLIYSIGLFTLNTNDMRDSRHAQYLATAHEALLQCSKINCLSRTLTQNIPNNLY